MKAILAAMMCLAACACRSEDETAGASADPMRAQRASKALSEAVIEEMVAEAQSKRDASSQHAAAKFKIAADRLAEAKAEAKAAGMTEQEITFKILDAQGEGLEKAYPKE